jgi:hypothetical protein
VGRMGDMEGMDEARVATKNRPDVYIHEGP